jgi:hypothetical protein
MSRKVYLVILTAIVLAVALSGVYLRQRAKAAARPPSAPAANCDTPAPPPPPTTPPPKLPGFQIEAACGSEAAKPAKPIKPPDRKKQ